MQRGHPHNHVVGDLRVEPRHTRRPRRRPWTAVYRHRLESSAQSVDQTPKGSALRSRNGDLDIHLAFGPEPVQRDREALLARNRPHGNLAARARHLGEPRVEDAQERMQPHRRGHRGRRIDVEHVLRNRHCRTQAVDTAHAGRRDASAMTTEREESMNRRLASL